MGCATKDLLPRYRFRVKAVNKLGQSLPCDMKGGAIVIKVRMMRMRMNFVKKKCCEGILLVKGHGCLNSLQKPGNLFPFWVLFIPAGPVLPDHIAAQVGVNVTPKIVECRYRSDGP